MPALEALTPLGRQILNELPGWAQNDPLYRAAAHIWAKESELMQGRAAEVRDAAIPSQKNPLLLEVWEVSLHLPRNPPEKNEAERWEAVLARLRRAIEDPSGTSWVKRVTEQIGLGWTYEEKAPDIIEVTVPWPAGSERFIFARAILEAEIPAAWELVIGSAEGFTLDQSKLDVEPFHPE